ncbi:UNVERIFIED_CONTAM: hypothetical protein Sangu_0726100 [Sesamum angustifolium]|uniref:ER membrane protein complex subunit 10 n=1 Tax=Sesamum angustifolium TaxID=2727405 RepID=A0AAW2PU24_9LAMI
MRFRFSSSLLSLIFIVNLSLYLAATSSAFQSDELLADDEEFGIEGGRSPDPASTTRPTYTPPSTRKRAFESGSDPDSKVQFTLEHAFGDSEFSPAGTFSARLKTSSHGGQTLTKLRFSRNVFSETEKENFKRCLPREALDEYFVIHMEGVNILAVNYGSPGSCQYPRQLKLPTKWSFKSHTVLKNSEQAPRTPVFTDEAVGENGEGEEVKPPERSFWAKYWMYLIPLGLIVMNAVTQAMNMAEEQPNAQPGSQTQAEVAARGQATAVRRR